jgi:hypothetical protein
MPTIEVSPVSVTDEYMTTHLQGQSLIKYIIACKRKPVQSEIDRLLVPAKFCFVSYRDFSLFALAAIVVKVNKGNTTCLNKCVDHYKLDIMATCFNTIYVNQAAC